MGKAQYFSTLEGVVVPVDELSTGATAPFFVSNKMFWLYKETVGFCQTVFRTRQPVLTKFTRQVDYNGTIFMKGICIFYEKRYRHQKEGFNSGNFS